MSRLLTLLLLYHFDYEVGRYISLERIFEETKESYYETLEASSQGWHQGQHDVKPWLDYFWGALLRAYREFEERVGTIERGRGSKGDRVRTEVLGRTLPFSISEIEEACPGVSRDMVRLVLRAMKSEGLIESTGKGEGRSGFAPINWVRNEYSTKHHQSWHPRQPYSRQGRRLPGRENGRGQPTFRGVCLLHHLRLRCAVQSA